MQKKLIALAIAGLASSAAFADSNVTIYGRVDFGMMSRSGDSGGLQDQKAKTEFASGIQSGSRIGFKGSEDLGNGLKVIFESEFQQKIDEGTTSAATWGNRHSYVGLTGGFGTFVGGRLDGVRYGVFGTYDPFGLGTVGNFAQMTTQYDRADNAIAYISPNWSGFGLVLAYATTTHGAEGSAAYNPMGGSRGNGGDDQLFTIMGTYDNGPFSARLDYETTRTRNFDNDNRLFVFTAGASYDFGVVKVSALYDVIKGDQNSFIGSIGGLNALNVLAGSNGLTSGKYDRRNWLVGVKAPIGKFTAKASYGRVHNKEIDDADASKWSLGVDYALSKRTNLYADITKINNDDNATFGVSPSAASAGIGVGSKAIDFGIAHNF